MSTSVATTICAPLRPQHPAAAGARPAAPRRATSVSSSTGVAPTSPPPHAGVASSTVGSAAARRSTAREHRRGSARRSRAAPRACRRRRRARRRAARRGRRARSSPGRWAMMIVVRPCHHLGERGADLVLLRRVDRRRRVVEDQDPRVGEHRARDRDALPLPTRQREAVLADDRLVAVGQLVDEVVGAREPRGAHAPRPSTPPGRRTRCCRARVSENRNVSSNTMPTARRSSLQAAARARRRRRAARARRRRRRSAGRARATVVLPAAGRADERDRLARRGSRGRGRRAPAGPAP